MVEKQMKTFNVGNTRYIVNDAEAREDIEELQDALSPLEVAAESEDVGKALKAKTISGGKVTEYELGYAAIIDDTLSVAGEAADAKETGDAIADLDAAKVNKPTTSPNGTSGQLLRTNGDGTTIWVDQGLPTDQQTADAVEAWLDDHPEATTTVQDGAITRAKLDSNLQGAVDDVDDLRSQMNNIAGVTQSIVSGVANLNFASGATAFSSSNDYRARYFPVISGYNYTYTIISTYSPSDYRIVLSQNEPANGIAGEIIDIISAGASTHAEFTQTVTYTATSNGYLSVVHYRSSTEDAAIIDMTGHYNGQIDTISDAVSDLTSAVDDLIIVSDTQPVSEDNELWIQETNGSEVEVPDMAEFNNLKSQISDINDAINYFPQEILFDKSLNTSSGTGVLPTNIANEYKWACICVSCAPGDMFAVTGTGGSIARLWAFSDAEGVVIEQAASGATGNELKKTAPANAAYFTYNVRYKQNGVLLPYGVYKGEKPKDTLDAIETQISELSGEIDDINDDLADSLYYDKTDDISTGMTWTSGYVNKGGSQNTNDSYHYSESILVGAGDVLSTGDSFRYLTAYVNGTANADLGAEFVISYTVPATVTAVVVSMAVEATSIRHKYRVKADDLAETVKTMERKLDGVTFYNNRTVVSATAETLTNGQVLTACQNIDNKKGDTIIFYAEVDAQTFGSVTVGHGQGISYGASVKVDATKITMVYGTNADYYHTDHNLTIDKFLMIEIKHTNDARASVRIITASGSCDVASGNVPWGGCKGDVFALSTNSALANVKLSSTFADFDHDIYLFGDSYVGLGDLTKYTTLLINNGYTNLMIDGFGGRKSAEAILSFRNVIQMAKPKYAIWALGMNNSDTSSAINASYKACLDEFVQTCVTNDIVPILATIPNTPERLHTYKNAYVKSLASQNQYRYIDFAAAVGAEEAESTWYDGMLEELSQTVLERVHPTALGAKALYARFLIDVPEIADLN